MTRIEAKERFHEILDLMGVEWALSQLIADQDDRIDAYKGSADRIVQSWHKTAIERKALLTQCLGGEKTLATFQEYFDDNAFYQGAKGE